MAAGVVLAAVGLENTVAHVDEPAATVPAFALLGGVALYLVAHVALGLRSGRSLDFRRLVPAAVLPALIRAAVRLPSLYALAGVVVLLWLLIGVEATSRGEARAQVRWGAQLAGSESPRCRSHQAVGLLNVADLEAASHLKVADHEAASHLNVAGGAMRTLTAARRGRNGEAHCGSPPGRPRRPRDLDRTATARELDRTATVRHRADLAWRPSTSSKG